jgi:polar amino acid transport system permease protein
MDALIQQFFNIEIMRQSLPLMLRGLGMTALLCLAVIPLGLIGGLGVALLGTRRSWVVRRLVALYVDLFRAIPPLVLLILIYSALPFAGINLSPFTAVAIALFLNTSSFYGEILRAGIESIGQGQWHAARSTGLSLVQAIQHVILPQAVRNVARSRLKHARSREAHGVGFRCVVQGVALFGGNGALGHLQCVADHAGRNHLSDYIVAIGSPRQSP